MNKSRFHRRAFAAAALGTGVGAAVSLVEADNAAAKDNAHEALLRQTEDGVVHHPFDPNETLMDGFPPPKDKRVTIENYTDSVLKTRWAQHNNDRIFKTVEIERGQDGIRPLSRRMIDPEKLARCQVLWGPSTDAAKNTTFLDWLHQSQTDAIVMLHDGKIVAEHYFGSMTPKSRQLLWSCGKSLLSCLVHQEMSRRAVSEDLQVDKVIEELEGTALAGATVRHLLDQVTGIDFKMFASPGDRPETIKQYTFGTPEYRSAPLGMPQYSRTFGVLPLAPDDPKDCGLYDFLFRHARASRRIRAHGKALWYAILHEIALQLTLERITNRSFVELMSDNLWSHLGAEHRAGVVVDCLGTPATGGLSFTARDGARWCQMLLDGGRVGNQQVVPQHLMKDLLQRRNEELINAQSNMGGLVLPRTGYRSMFWSYANDDPGKPFLNAVGFNSQHCFIDPQRGNVIIKFSSNPDLGQITHDIVALKSLSRMLPELAE